MSKCHVCNKKLNGEGALRQHMKAKHPAEYKVYKQQQFEASARAARNGGDKATLAGIANEVFGDLPDGAFFAAAGDCFGLDPEDFVQ